MAKNNADYTQLSTSLDEVLDKLQQPNIQVDEAVALYEQGLDIVRQLETHLAQAENQVKQLSLRKEEA